MLIHRRARRSAQPLGGTAMSSDHPSDESRPVRNVEDVRALYRPAADYRISPATHAAGASFEEIAKSGEVHILSGSCEFKFPHHTFALSTGQSATLPSGTYTFEAKGEEPVELVRVWHLPT